MASALSAVVRVRVAPADGPRSGVLLRSRLRDVIPAQTLTQALVAAPLLANADEVVGLPSEVMGNVGSVLIWPTVFSKFS